MPNIKISALTSATTPLAGTETLPVVQSGATKQVSVANLTVGRTVIMGSFSVNPAADTNAVGTISAIPRTTVGQSEASLSLQAYSRETTNNRQALYALRVDPDSDFGSAAFKIDYTYDGTSYGTRWGVDNSGNLFQGTAAKGVNFTANTPAAGMTSQLLNWYEEGTWTPSTAYATFVGAASSSGTYTRVGRQVTVNGILTGATSVTVGASGILTSSLPFNASSDGIGSMAASTNTASGVVRVTGPYVVAVTTMSPVGSITFTATYFV
jgi:hypothetical protein